jgi:hypothetical protein
MVNEVHLVYEQLILCIILLIGFLGSGNPLLLFVCFGGLAGILILTIKIKKYDSKLYNLVSVPILIFQGLILIYTYLFTLKSPQTLSYILLFYSLAIIWIFPTSYYIYYYSQKLYKRS